MVCSIRRSEARSKNVPCSSSFVVVALEPGDRLPCRDCRRSLFCLLHRGQGCEAISDALADLVPLRSARLQHLFEAHLHPGQFRADSRADKTIVVKDPDHGKVARIVANEDVFADIGSKVDVEIAVPVEAYPVLLDPPLLCFLEEQEIELLQGLGHARKEAACLPARLRRLLGLRMHPRMVVVQQPRAKTAIKGGQRQIRAVGFAVVSDKARQAGQEQLFDSAEEALDLSPPAGLPRPGKYQRHFEIGGNLFQMSAAEISAMVGVELHRYAADAPAGIGLAPDRLVEGHTNGG